MKRIQYKLLIILLVGALTPMLVTEFFSLRTAKAAQEQELLQNLDSIVVQKKRMIEELFTQETSHIQIYSNFPASMTSVERLISGFSQGIASDTYQSELNRITPLMSSIMDLRQLRNIYVVSRQGQIVYSHQKASDFGINLLNGQHNQSHFAQLIQRTLADKTTSHTKFDVYSADDNNFSAFIATPIIKNNKTIGVLAFQLTSDILFSIAQDYTALENTGETVFARLDGDKALFITPSRFKADGANNFTVPLAIDNVLPIREAVQGVHGKGASIDYRGVPILASWSYLPEYNFGMVVKIDQREAFNNVAEHEHMIYVIALLITIPCLIFSYFVSRRFTQPIISIVESTKTITKGDLNHKIKVGSEDEIGQLASSINEMSDHINRAFKDEEAKRWVQSGIEQLSQTMRGNQISSDLSDNIVAFVSSYLNAKVGSLYIVKDQELELAGGFAFVPHFGNQIIAFGDGLVGQTAITKQHMMINELPEDYASISSSLGEITPKNLLIYPIIKEDVVHAVIELGWISESHPHALEFLDTIAESVGTALGVADSHNKLQVLLDQSQQQMEELQVREEELRAINEEVEKRSTQLAQSQKDLERQTDRLQETNDALEHKTLSLESKNQEIELSKQELITKAEQLEASSKYKSEFLANMSHELRTPLNSMLILSRILADNDEQNLDEDQVESAQVINNSGKQLLTLINDILDLSKIEAGKMEVHFEDYSLAGILNELQSQFQPLANEKGLQLLQHVAPDVDIVQSFDVQKTQQILKNLLSNSLKFTESGSVTISVSVASTQRQYINNKLNDAPVLAISVIDTGIGISEEKSQAIFEAFQQADGSTSRKYGGTGLGLTISRHLTALIGGELSVISKKGQGSTFTLNLPLRTVQNPIENNAAPARLFDTLATTPVNDQGAVQAEKVILDNETQAISKHTDNDENLIVIVEDDHNFSKILGKLAKKAGFSSMSADSGKLGLEYIYQHNPCGVILDLGLPDIEGSELLTQLKANDKTKDIPVHIISGETRSEELTRIGAQGYHQKPVDRQQLNNLFNSFNTTTSNNEKKKIIIFDDSSANTRLDLSFLNQAQVDTVIVHSFDELSHNLGNSEEPIKGIIIKTHALQQGCNDWLDDNYQYVQELDISVMLFVDNEPQDSQKDKLEKYGTHVILDGPYSDQRLHDEVSLFFSQFDVNETPAKPTPKMQPVTTPVQPATSLSEEKHSEDSISVQGCNVLLVDDDLRNTFALSKVLKKQGMSVTLADNGQMALDKLYADDNIDIVLMDIMMPVMDGYEAMSKIRESDKYRELPIIALTAKAMQEDRRKCVEAGASDYLTKPVDVDKLVAMMKVWLYKEVSKTQ